MVAHNLWALLNQGMSIAAAAVHRSFPLLLNLVGGGERGKREGKSKHHIQFTEYAELPAGAVLICWGALRVHCACNTQPKWDATAPA